MSENRLPVAVRPLLDHLVLVRPAGHEAVRALHREARPVALVVELTVELALAHVSVACVS